jgi:hypothetical protein
MISDLLKIQKKDARAMALETDRFYVDPLRGDPLVTGVRWLSVESTLRWLDPLLVVSQPPRVQDLAAALGDATAIALLARHIIRFSGQHLQLLEIREVHRRGRQNHVALAFGLSDDELDVVDRMNLAALCVVPGRLHVPVRWLTRSNPVWIRQPEPTVSSAPLPPPCDAFA